MKKYSKLISILLAAVMLMAMLASCSGEGDTPNEPGSTNDPGSTNQPGSNDPGTSNGETNADRTSSKDTLVIRLQSDPGTLDNLANTDIVGIQVFSCVGNTLLAASEEDSGREFICDDKYSLATSYEFDDDNMGVTFHLRQGVKFHDGSELKASDVVFSAKRYAGNARYDYIDFENITAVDDSTVYFPFTKTNASVLSTLGWSFHVVKEAHVGDESDPTVFSSNWVGTGPYKVTKWVSGDSITLEAFDDYFGGKPIIKNIIFRVIPEASVAMMEMETGGVDIIDLPAWTDVQNVMDGMYEGQVKYTVTMGDMAVQLGFNASKDSPCNDLRVRQAVCYALDRDAIIYGAYEGVAEAMYTVVSKTFQNLNDYTDNWPYPHDPEKAKQLLADAGYADGLTLTVLHNNDANRVLACEIMSNQLREVGINLEVKGFDTATYSAMMSSETDSWDMWVRNWGGTGSCASYFVTTITANCHPADDDEAFWRAYDLANQAYEDLNDETRIATTHQLEDMWLTECLHTYPLCQTVLYLLFTDNMTGAYRVGYDWRLVDAYFA